MTTDTRLQDEHDLASDLLSDLPLQKIVGIGASAGGIAALQTLFAHLSADMDMAFVVIMHLSPEYESQAAAILQQTTDMPVVQITTRVAVLPNRVYVIPPAKHVTIVAGELHLQDREKVHTVQAPIDLFLRTLAETNRDQAVAIILSGAGSDGTMGVQRIKECDGVVFVQDPREAGHTGMPESAIATGIVDFVLPVAAIAEQLRTYWQHKIQIEADPPTELQPPPEDVPTLREVFTLLRMRTGHHFGQYKRPTILRRIARRMLVRGVVDLRNYLAVLRTDPDEASALQRDLLISVTNFFRDPEAWRALEMAIPRLFANKTSTDQVRVWVTACATGEEAYSIAILLHEYALSIDQPPRIQVFATDIDDDAIIVARQGLYRETIAIDVSQERLQRFFTHEHGGYRIIKTIRDMVLFASHNLLHDPPFSRLDLITCRNLLIYLNHEAQEYVLRMFHFTLRQRGYLFLGTSESTDSNNGMFTLVDKGQRLFQRNPISNTLPPVVLTSPQTHMISSPHELGGARPDALRPFARDLDLSALAQYGPPTIIVDSAHNIIHVARGAGRFLQVADGTLSPNLLRLIHPRLHFDLRNALFVATRDGLRVDVGPLQIEIDGITHLIAPVVQPIVDLPAMQGLLLVMLYPFGTAKNTTESVSSEPEDHVAVSIAQAISADLEHTRYQLQLTVEQYETEVEEHKAANEELQAINEELRAASEELETSKEELQSVNEELITVNAALKQKIDELSQSNNDLQNLISATDIATLFIDRTLRIKWYTPSMDAIFNLIRADINRPLAHVTHTLEYPTLFSDIQQVLRTLGPIEREVRNFYERWYIARIRPYRTREDKIDGVVLTFVDITERKFVAAALQASEERARLVIESVQDYAIFTTDPDSHVDSWNAGAERIMGYTEAEILDQKVAILFTPEDRATNVVEQELQTAREYGSAADERWHIRKDGTQFYASGVTTPLRDATGTLRGYVKVMRDLTNWKQTQEALREGNAALEIRVQERTVALATANTQLHTLLNALVTAQEDERKRVARELHDQLGQSLTALRLGLVTLMPGANGEATLPANIERLQEIARQLDNDVDQLALELRPNVLDNLGLVEAVQHHIGRWMEHSSIPVDLHVGMLEETRLAPELEIIIYRVVQEALTNILKHAYAQQVSITMLQSARDVRVIIEDDGQGFEVETIDTISRPSPRLGLMGMHERVAAVGGELTVEANLGKGTALYVTIPLPAALSDSPAEV